MLCLLACPEQVRAQPVFHWLVTHTLAEMPPRKGPSDPLNVKKETLAAVLLADSFTQVISYYACMHLSSCCCSGCAAS